MSGGGEEAGMLRELALPGRGGGESGLEEDDTATTTCSTRTSLLNGAAGNLGPVGMA